MGDSEVATRHVLIILRISLTRLRPNLTSMECLGDLPVRGRDLQNESVPAYMRPKALAGLLTASDDQPGVRVFRSTGTGRSEIIM